MKNKAYFWLAVNGPFVSLCPFPAFPHIIAAKPTPEQLLGFESLGEAKEMHLFLLHAPIESVRARCAKGLDPKTHCIIRPASPEEPSGLTAWWLKCPEKDQPNTATDGNHRLDGFSLN